jgi:hypothetical protein
MRNYIIFVFLDEEKNMQSVKLFIKQILRILTVILKAYIKKYICI